MKNPKLRFRKSIAALLSVLMLSTAIAVPITASADELSDLKSAISTYESKMNGSSFYTNMTTAYNAYVAANQALWSGDPSAMSTAAANLTNATNNMGAWTSYTGTASNRFAQDSSDPGNTPSYYKNIMYAPQSGYGVSATASDFTPSEVVCSVLYNSSVMLYDGITTPQIPIMAWFRRTGGNTRYMYAIYPAANMNGDANDANLTIPSWWHSDRGATADFTWCIEQGESFAYNAATGCKANGAQSTDHRSADMQRTGMWGSYKYPLIYAANTLQFTGSFTSGEYSKTMLPIWYVSSGNDPNSDVSALTATRPLYVVNYKALIDSVNSSKSKLNVADYKQGGLSQLVAAYDTATTLNPTSYNYEDTANAVNSCATAISNAVSGVNNASLTKDTYTYTYTNHAGSVMSAQTVSSASELTAVSNTADVVSYTSNNNNTDHAKTTVSYAWQAPVQTSINAFSVSEAETPSVINEACSFVKGDEPTATTEATIGAPGTATYCYTCSVCGQSYDLAENVGAAVDTTALTDAIASANALSESGYTADSWQALLTAVTNAQSVLNTSTSNAQAVADATAAVNTAIADLVEKQTEATYIYVNAAGDTVSTQTVTSAGNLIAPDNTQIKTVTEKYDADTHKVTVTTYTWGEPVKTDTGYTISETGTDSVEYVSHTTEVRNAVDADCENPGYTGDTYCTVCGDKISEGQIIPAIGHAYVYTTKSGDTATFTCANNSDHTVTASIEAYNKISIVYNTIDLNKYTSTAQAALADAKAAFDNVTSTGNTSQYADSAAAQKAIDDATAALLSAISTANDDANLTKYPVKIMVNGTLNSETTAYYSTAREYSYTPSENETISNWAVTTGSGTVNIKSTSNSIIYAATSAIASGDNAGYVVIDITTSMQAQESDKCITGQFGEKVFGSAYLTEGTQVTVDGYNLVANDNVIMKAQVLSFYDKISYWSIDGKVCHDGDTIMVNGDMLAIPHYEVTDSYTVQLEDSNAGTITVYNTSKSNKTITAQGTAVSPVFDQYIELSAADATDFYAWALVTDGGYEIVSYNETAAIFCEGNTTYKILRTSDVPNGNKSPVIRMRSASMASGAETGSNGTFYKAPDVDGKYRVTFCLQSVVPGADYKVKACGVVVSQSADNGNDFKLGDSGIKNFVSPSQAVSGQFAIALSSSKDITYLNARGYVTYTYTYNGQTITSTDYTDAVLARG